MHTCQFLNSISGNMLAWNRVCMTFLLCSNGDNVYFWEAHPSVRYFNTTVLSRGEGNAWMKSFIFCWCKRCCVRSVGYYSQCLCPTPEGPSAYVSQMMCTLEAQELVCWSTDVVASPYVGLRRGNTSGTNIASVMQPVAVAASALPAKFDFNFPFITDFQIYLRIHLCWCEVEQESKVKTRLWPDPFSPEKQENEKKPFVPSIFFTFKPLVFISIITALSAEFFNLPNRSRLSLLSEIKSSCQRVSLGAVEDYWLYKGK